MKTRLIRPEFFSDTKLADLDDGARLLYIGLWAIADDDGYFEWDLRAIAAVLYPFRDEAVRRPAVERWIGELRTLDRVRELECGVHGLVPTLPTHRAKGGNSTYSHRDKHRRACLSVRVRTGTYTNVSESGNESGNESGRSGALEESFRATGGFAAGLAERARNGQKESRPVQAGSRKEGATGTPKLPGSPSQASTVKEGIS